MAFCPRVQCLIKSYYMHSLTSDFYYKTVAKEMEILQTFRQYAHPLNSYRNSQISVAFKYINVLNFVYVQ